MPANPHKIPCSVPGCRAWAMHDSDPPTCSVHAGRPAAARCGAPPRNQNARKHGFYSPMIAIADLVDLAACGDQITLDAEVACARIVLRGLLGQLRDLDHSSPAEYGRLSGLALQAARTVARLLRDKRVLAADQDGTVPAIISEAMDSLPQDSRTIPGAATDDR